MISIRHWISLTRRHHVCGSLAIVVFTCWVISSQVADRGEFADSELRRDVMDRWGAPIVQLAPSVRYVPSGSVFNALHALPLASQSIDVAATMNYRKRGLVYFSGFDLSFRGSYAFANPQDHSIDAAFVFPINLQKNKVLLSGLHFRVNGEDAPIDLTDDSEKLLWTGRLQPGEEVEVEIGFQGRGLDSFLYRLDPDLPVRDFLLRMEIVGGANFDYAPGVVPATLSDTVEEGTALAWAFESLESGVPVGVLLPSEKSFDRIIRTMVARAWPLSTLFLVGLIFVARHFDAQLAFYQTYLIAAAYAFFFVLLAYLAAFMNFYVAYVVTASVVGGLIAVYGMRVLSPAAAPLIAGLFVAFQIVPTVAVILEGYTGLIYCLEILVGLGVLMFLTAREPFKREIARLLESSTGTEGADAATV